MSGEPPPLGLCWTCPPSHALHVISSSLARWSPGDSGAHAISWGDEQREQARRIVQVGAPEEIFHRPTSAFVAGFMGADNAIDVAQRDDGVLISAAEGRPDRRVRAHFRSDSARMCPTSREPRSQHKSASARNSTGNPQTRQGT